MSSMSMYILLNWDTTKNENIDTENEMWEV